MHTKQLMRRQADAPSILPAGVLQKSAKPGSYFRNRGFAKVIIMEETGISRNRDFANQSRGFATNFQDRVWNA